MTTQWTGFADYVESFGSKPSGHGNDASFSAMLEAALAAEEASGTDAACAPPFAGSLSHEGRRGEV